jgi:hypothetical protein
MDLIADELFECLMAVVLSLADLVLWLIEAFQEER